MADILPGSSNPYFAKAKISHLEMFFGRADLLMSVYEMVLNRQCVSIVGPRGIGKTSFLWYASLPEVQKAFPFDLNRHIFIFLDLRTFLRKTGEDFFHQVSAEMKNAGEKRGLKLYSYGNGEDEFSNILDQIEEQGYFPVLLLDAFDKVTLNEHFDLAFFEFLRALASAGLVSYITASLAPLSKICHSGVAGSPFFNIFYTSSLAAFASEEARTLITLPAQQSGLAFSNQETDWVLNQAGRHPFFIQRVCYLLWERKRNGGKIDAKLLREQAYKELAPVFEDIWEQLSREQKELLQDEAQQKVRQQRQLPELSESALFRLFVRRTCRASFFGLTNAQLEEALEKINDLAELGETDLRLMKAVAHRLKNQDTPTAIDKGRVIKEVLSEALQVLRGSGVQLDSSADWKYYNILYYRYFKYHLKNEQIAARLEFASNRTFFRERGRAIQALRQELIKMELDADRLEDDDE